MNLLEQCVAAVSAHLRIKVVCNILREVAAKEVQARLFTTM